jgi:uncharacterized protein (DUF2235 family)
MEKLINMKEREKVQKIINEITDSSNKEIVFVLDFLNKEFEDTKLNIIKLTNHLDNLELTYNKVLKEHEKRTNGGR